MRKRLQSTVLLLVVGFMSMSAQVATTKATKRAIQNSTNVDVQRVPVSAQQFQQAKSAKTRESSSVAHAVKSFKPITVERNAKATRAASDLLSGTFVANGNSYFNGKTTWPIGIKQDAGDATKYWFTNIVPAATTEEIYAILNGNTLSFPIGQIAVKNVDFKAAFYGFDGDKLIATGSITATIDESKHTITFTNGFGSVITEYPSEPSSVGAAFDLINPGTNCISDAYFAPYTSYKAPTGALNYGFSRDYYSLSIPQSIASPYVQWNWKNTSFAFTEGTTWLWSYTDPEENTVTSANVHLSFDAVPGSYSVPSLKGTYKGNDSTYIWGASFENYGQERYIAAGGSSIVSPTGKIFDITNANLDYANVSWHFAEGVYPFGTGTNSNGWATDELISLYEKPQSTLIFEGVDIYLGKFVAPASIEFKLYIVKSEVDEDGFPIFGDTIAIGTATPSAVLKAEEGFYCLPFEKFVAMDEDGFESELEYVEANDQFALIFTGYNKPGVELSVYSEYLDRPDNENYSFFTYIDPKSKKQVLSSWIDIKNTMYMQLHNAAYSYITQNKKEINADVKGGTYDLTLSPYFNNLTLIEETCPDWISIKQTDHFVEDNWGSDLEIKVNELPTDVTGRSADIKYTTSGASCIIRVTQGAVTGITKDELSSIKAFVSGDNFDLFYPEGTTTVTLMNVAGQILATYELPAGGKFTMPASDLSKGIYLMKFNGNKTIKVVK